MSKSLTAWLCLIIATLALWGCGADNQVASELENEPCKGADANSAACLPPPDPCDLLPLSVDCLPDLLSITSPARNSLWSTPTMTLSVAFLEGSVPSNLQLTLNGQDVRRRAAINATGAVINGSAIEALLIDGDNTFQAQSGGEIEKLVFVYDSEAPRIIVTAANSVGSGSTSPKPGDTIKVSGVVRDAAAVSNLTINGAAATFSNGHDFVAEIPYADIYRLVATDANSQIGRINFAAPQHRFDPAVALQVNNSIFNLIKPLINQALAKVDMSTMINSNQRTPFGTGEIAVTQLDIGKGGEPSIDMHFVPAALTSASRPMVVEVGVTLPQVGVVMSLYQARKVAPVANIGIDIYNVNVTLQLTLTVDSSNHVKVGLTSNAPFNLTFSKISNRFDVACVNALCEQLTNLANQLLSNIENLLFNDVASRDLLLKLLNTGLTPSLTNALAKLDLSLMPTNIPLDTNGDGNTDTQIAWDMGLSLLTTDTYGNSNMEFAGNIGVGNKFLSPNYHGALGSVYVDTGAAPAFDRTAKDGSEFDLGIALPSNILNQALLSLYQGGVLDHIAIALKPDDLGSMGSMLSLIGVDDSADIRMRLVPGAVPYISLDHVTTTGKTAGLKFHLDNASIYMDVKKAGDADFSVMLAMVADIAANLELGINNSNYIDLATDDLVAMDVISILRQTMPWPKR